MNNFGNPRGTDAVIGGLEPAFKGICNLPWPLSSHHIFICGKSRKAGSSRGSCDPDEKEALKSVFKKELKKAGLSRTVRTQQTNCLDQCEHGPVVVIYPQGLWYGTVQPDDVPRIVAETIGRGTVLPDLVIADSCLNNPDCPHRGGP